MRTFCTYALPNRLETEYEKGLEGAAVREGGDLLGVVGAAGGGVTGGDAVAGALRKAGPGADWLGVDGVVAGVDVLVLCCGDVASPRSGIMCLDACFVL